MLSLQHAFGGGNSMNTACESLMRLPWELGSLMDVLMGDWCYAMGYMLYTPYILPCSLARVGLKSEWLITSLKTGLDCVLLGQRDKKLDVGAYRETKRCKVSRMQSNTVRSLGQATVLNG